MSQYLLDVNALVAWGQARAPQHGTFHAWAARQGFGEIATCAHAELGYRRISMQVFGDSPADAQKQLTAMKSAAGGFIDNAPTQKLPGWVAKAAHTSDAYLMQVAAASRLSLATFDKGIPGATLIR